MTAAVGTTARAEAGRGRIVFWLGLLGVILLLAVVAGAPRPSIPLSPRSTTPEGTRGLVLFLEELGATVDISRDAPTSSDDVALVLVDDLGDERREVVRDWVRGGGTLVVADPSSPLAAQIDEDVGGIGFGGAARGTCDIAELQGAESVTVVGTELFDAPEALFDVPDDARSCFGDGRAALVVREELGDGDIVSIGSADLFTNQNLDEDDNAVVAAAFLVPEPGPTVRLLEAPVEAGGEGRQTLTDLIPDNVVLAFVQVLVAFVVYALWRARRLGRPVAETQPVEVAGSELVAAVGGLLEVAQAPGAAAELLRADLRRDLGLRFGITPETPPEAAARIVAHRTGADPGRIHAALVAVPPLSDAELVEFARLVDAVRQEVFRGQRG
jgi:hypothetical protein